MDFGETGITEFRGAFAEVAKAEQGVPFWRAFSEKPSDLRVGGDEFYDGVVILFVPSGQVGVVPEGCEVRE